MPTPFVDDIIIGSGTENMTEDELIEAHDKDLRRVLSELDKHNMVCKPTKASLFVKEVEFAGHVVGHGQRRPMPLPPTQERGEDSKETARGQGGGQRTDRNAGGRDEWRAVEVKKKRRVGQPNVVMGAIEAYRLNAGPFGGRDLDLVNPSGKQFDPLCLANDPDTAAKLKVRRTRRAVWRCFPCSATMCRRPSPARALLSTRPPTMLILSR